MMRNNVHTITRDRAWSVVVETMRPLPRNRVTLRRGIGFGRGI